jgi:photosystem II stability/assembly factor-like uncharacterized protein
VSLFSHRIDTVRLWAGSLLLCSLWTRAAQANGAFPAVSQLVADPARAAHLVLRSNFGLLTTSDRGTTWDLVCEAGIGYQNIEPGIAVLGDGSTIAALGAGIARSDAAECDFTLGSGMSAYVADVSRVPGSQLEAVAVSVDMDQGESQVWHSTDSGQSWQALGSALPNLNALTLDVASDDPNTLYVSGTTQSASVSGVLAHSADAGQHWDVRNIPGVSKISAPYIAAVADAQTVYVRLSGSPGSLLVTRDSGMNFRTVLTFRGPFDGFALSPDGQLALASGRSDGVWRASTQSLAFEQLSCAEVRCLSWSAAGLFACADEFEAGFLVGESVDRGLTFEPRLHLSCVRGPLSCASGSSVGSVCPAAWPAISEQLGTDCANAGSFTPVTACAGGSSGSAAGEAGANSAEGGVRNAPEAGGASGSYTPHGGCSVGHAHGSAKAWLTWLGLGLSLSVARRRMRVSARRHANYAPLGIGRRPPSLALGRKSTK